MCIRDRSCAERQQRKLAEPFQFRPGKGMRKEIQHHSSCYSQFFTEQECVREVTQRLVVCDDDQFVNATTFEEILHFPLLKDTCEMKSPHAMLFDLSGEIMSGPAHADHGNVADVQCAVFLQPDEQNTVCHQQEVINHQREDSNEAMSGEFVPAAHKELSGKQGQPC